MLGALSLFGENSKSSLVLHLAQQGVIFTGDGFDVSKFCSVVEGLLAGGSSLLFAKIIDDLCKLQSISLEDLGLAARSKYLPYSQLLQELIAKIEA